jgi:hypothetical protein
MVMKGFSTIACAAAALLLTGASSSLADSTSGLAPKPADVATLRGLLALQYPTLRQVSAAPEVAAPAPSVTAEPDRGTAIATAEGGA